MRFVAVGQEAVGVVAIGQQATGVIAIGQLATGVIAIGQLARGVVVVAQLGCGVAVLGQLVAGIWTAGIGVGGVRGPGLVLGAFGRLDLRPWRYRPPAQGWRSGWWWRLPTAVAVVTLVAVAALGPLVGDLVREGGPLVDVPTTRPLR